MKSAKTFINVIPKSFLTCIYSTIIYKSYLFTNTIDRALKLRRHQYPHEKWIRYD